MLSVPAHPEKALLTVGICQGRQGQVVQPAFDFPAKLAPVQVHERQPSFPEKKQQKRDSAKLVAKQESSMLYIRCRGAINL